MDGEVANQKSVILKTQRNPPFNVFTRYTGVEVFGVFNDHKGSVET